MKSETKLIFHFEITFLKDFGIITHQKSEDDAEENNNYWMELAIHLSCKTNKKILLSNLRLENKFSVWKFKNLPVTQIIREIRV